MIVKKLIEEVKTALQVCMDDQHLEIRLSTMLEQEFQTRAQQENLTQAEREAFWENV